MRESCWKRIGVYGDGSCPELAEHIHCRNCPVYVGAAAAFLDRETPADYVATWTKNLAQEPKQEEAGRESVFIFRLGAEWLCLPTSLLKEVGEVRAIHSLPHRRSGAILGLTNVRGQLTICVSLSEILGTGEGPKKGEKAIHPRMLVAELDGLRLVFPVDEVHGTHRACLAQLGPLPATVSKATATYSKGLLDWEGRSVGLLDAQLLFYTCSQNLG